MPLGAVLDHQAQAKLARDPDRGRDIIGAMGVRAQRDLAADDREQRLQLHIGIDRFAFFARPGFPGVVVACLCQPLAIERRNRHARGRSLILTAVEPLRVLAKGGFHSDVLAE